MLKKIFSTMTMVSLALITGFLLTSLLPVSTVYAQSIATPIPQALKGLDQVLENQFKREQTLLSAEQSHLDKANQGIAKAQDLIDKATSEGKDVTALQTGLDAFKAQIASAQANLTTATGILSTHTGFDTSGTVTDRASAHQTVVAARQSLRGAHLAIAQGVHDFRQVLETWKQTHKATAGPDVISTPVPTPAS